MEYLRALFLAFFPSSRIYSPADIRRSDFVGESIKASIIIQCLSCQQEHYEVSENQCTSSTLCLFDAPQTHERPSCVPLSLALFLSQPIFSSLSCFSIQSLSALDSSAILHLLFPSWLLVPLSRCFGCGSFSHRKIHPHLLSLPPSLCVCVCSLPPV